MRMSNFVVRDAIVPALTAATKEGRHPGDGAEPPRRRLLPRRRPGRHRPGGHAAGAARDDRDRQAHRHPALPAPGRRPADRHPRPVARRRAVRQPRRRAGARFRPPRLPPGPPGGTPAGPGNRRPKHAATTRSSRPSGRRRPRTRSGRSWTELRRDGSPRVLDHSRSRFHRLSLFRVSPHEGDRLRPAGLPGWGNRHERHGRNGTDPADDPSGQPAGVALPARPGVLRGVQALRRRP